MKTLWLLRHAKASPGGSDLSDRNRPLAARGREGAERIGRHLAKSGARPDLVLCSSSLRTRETIERVAVALGGDLTIEFADDLYLASETDLLARVAELPDDVASVMMVGHNPGIAELALRLAVRGDRSALAELRRKFPTGALAELESAAPRWAQFARRCVLASYVTPKLLGD